jgi:23S rRNA (pseudouridine1915-N3)-methyltransferase
MIGMAIYSGSLTVAAVGKLKSPSWSAAQSLYVDRLRRYIPFALKEVKDAIGQGLPEKAALEKEGEALLISVKEARDLIVLTPAGSTYDSPQLAAFLKKQLETYGRVGFMLGGPAGVSENVMRASHSTLSLSKLTLPHELARIVFLEQLYRSFTILNGEKYHK